jgi:hypothetical protein
MKPLFVFHLRTFAVALVVAVLFSCRFSNVLTNIPSDADVAALEAMLPPDFDFNSFMAELEKELAAIEAGESGGLGGTGPASGKKPAPYGADAFDLKPTSSSSTKNSPASTDATTPTDDAISTDPETLITTPPMVTVRSNGKEMTLPHKKADEALCSYVNDILQALASIDRSAMGISNEEFIEYYLNEISPAVISARVAMEAMLDKKAYRVAVLNPPKEVAKTLDEYRKQIISARRQWMKLANELAISEQDEIRDEAGMQAELSSLLTKPAMESATATVLAPIGDTKKAAQPKTEKIARPAEAVQTDQSSEEEAYFEAMMQKFADSKTKAPLDLPGDLL